MNSLGIFRTCAQSVSKSGQALADISISPSLPFNHLLPANAFADANAGTVLTYSIAMNDGTALPTWLAFNPTTRTFSGNPGALGLFDLTGL